MDAMTDVVGREVTVQGGPAAPGVTDQAAHAGDHGAGVHMEAKIDGAVDVAGLTVGQDLPRGPVDHLLQNDLTTVDPAPSRPRMKGRQGPAPMTGRGVVPGIEWLGCV